MKGGDDNVTGDPQGTSARRDTDIIRMVWAVETYMARESWDALTTLNGALVLTTG